MISVICCSINSKFEVETFIRALHAHNNPKDFEICLCHDDRVNDGSNQHFKQLQQEFPNFKIIKNTHQDTIEYLTKLLDYYNRTKKFSRAFRDNLHDNLQKYIDSTLYNPTKSFLWLSSGILYNKAASIASGDVFIISPADYVYLFSLAKLEKYIKQHMSNGLFYGKPNGLRTPITNRPPKEILQRIRHKQSVRRSLLYCPPTLDNTCLVNPITNELTYLSDLKFLSKAKEICANVQNDKIKLARSVHGLHFMTRQTFNQIGGFTEEFYGRAWQDDKMNALGKKLFYTDRSKYIPPHFAFGWCSNMAVQNQDLKKKGARNNLKDIDPWFDKRPIAGLRDTRVYLHQGFDPNFTKSKIYRVLDKEFAQQGKIGRLSPPIKIMGDNK